MKLYHFIVTLQLDMHILALQFASSNAWLLLITKLISSLFLYKKDMKLLRTLHWELTLNSCSVKFIILFAKLFEVYRVSRNAVSVRNFGKSLLI